MFTVQLVLSALVTVMANEPYLPVVLEDEAALDCWGAGCGRALTRPREATATTVDMRKVICMMGS